MERAYKSNFKPHAYFALTYIFSYTFWIIAVIINKDITNTITKAFLYIGGIGPLLSAMIFVFSSKDKAFIKDYWRRVIDVREITLTGYLFIALFYPMLVLLSVAISLLFGGSIGQLKINSDYTAMNIVPSILFLLVFGPIPEELGWRGYAIDGLRQRFNGLIASFLLGVAWSLWHLPLFFIKGTYQNELLVSSPISTALFFVSIIPTTFILTYIFYKNNRSILSAILFHFVVNLIGNVFPNIGNRADIILFVLMILFSILLVIKNKDIFIYISKKNMINK